MPRILIIDDDEQVREFLGTMLRRAGYEVTEADNGYSGLEQNMENPADLVVTDILMPEKEGIETIMEMKKLFPRLRIIAISGGGSIGPNGYLKVASRVGADRVFPKPLDNDKLLAAIREQLSESDEKSPKPNGKKNSPPRILIVDDDQSVRRTLRKMLERSGYEVEDAADGDSGLKMYSENPADLVITDVIMPGKEGIEIIRELKRKSPDLKIIAISGGGLNLAADYLELTKSFGANRAIEKPFEKETMLSAIRELIGS